MIKHLSLLLPLLALACSSSKDTGTQVAPVPDSGATTTPPDEEVDAGEQPAVECTSARKTLLAPIAKVSEGDVKVVSTDNGVTKIYVDATAGGINKAKDNPRVYIKLDGTKVEIDDEQAFTSSDWDLAVRRTDIWTNGGDAGPGKGAGRLVEKDFAAVAAGDAANVSQEKFFTSADCEPNLDEASYVKTTFTGWYVYDEATFTPSAKPGVSFVVKSAAGTPYKVGIVSNTGNPDGTTNAPATARYIFQVAKL